MLLLENPKGDNMLDFTKFVDAVSCIFNLKNSKLTIFNGKTGKLPVRMDAECVHRIVIVDFKSI